jgi:antirestriction protein ArdC
VTQESSQLIQKVITERLLAAMEAGDAPWIRSWRTAWPRNALSRKPYHGINALLLSLTDQPTNYWLTYKQAETAGGNVKKGERSLPIAFFDSLYKDQAGRRIPAAEVERAKEEGVKMDRVPLLRYYSVFNVDQCEGLRLQYDPYPKKLDPEPEGTPRARAHEFIAALSEKVCPLRLAPSIECPQYRISNDVIVAPPQSSYTQPDRYFESVFHEYGHATGAATRLNRRGIVDFDNRSVEDQAFEELIAEISSSMTLGVLGFDPKKPDENYAAYLRHWAKVGRQRPGDLIKAAQMAGKATDFLFGAAPEFLPAALDPNPPPIPNADERLPQRSLQVAPAIAPELAIS